MWELGDLKWEVGAVVGESLKLRASLVIIAVFFLLFALIALKFQVISS